MKSNAQMAANNEMHTERAIGRIKEHHILQVVVPATKWDTIDQVVFICILNA